MGRLFYRKGVDLLVSVIPEVVKQHPDIEWVIVGDGPKKYLLDYVVQEQGLEENVRILGRVDHHLVQGLLESSNIYVNTSLTESFGIAVLEAAALGLTCVTTDVGAVHEIISNEELILTECTPNSILEGINKAIILNRLGTAHSNLNWG